MNSDLFDWQFRQGETSAIAPWKPRALNHVEWPPDYNGVYAWREQMLNELEASPDMLASAKAYYSIHRKEFIMHWMDTYDPRKTGIKWMPFIFFARQSEFIDFLEELRRDQESGLVEKCRDAGATWLACGYSVASWLFIDNDAIGWGSRKEILVDKLGDPDSIFEKMRLIIRRMPAIWLPKGLKEKEHLTFMKCINPENGSVIAGEAGDNIGRGGRKSIYFKDEAQPLTAGILTPSGWQTMGNMRVGSQVIGANGLPCVVTHINDAGIHPVYRVDFSDGTSTECSEHHLWMVEKKIGKRETLTLRTNDLIDKFRYVSPHGQVQFRYRIPVSKPVEFSSGATLPLHPWIVGALIGDGKVGDGCPVFTTNDPENVVRFAQYVPEGTRVSFDGKYGWRFVDSGNRYNKSSRAKNAVIAAGIYGCNAHEKFIPDAYKFASVNDRILLLQGLMDTDGSASGGVASFHSCSERLANDVRFIVQSLGGTATLNMKPDHRGYRDMFVVHMTIPDITPFALSRKIAELRSRSHPCDKTIVNIEYVRNDVVRCITVDALDGLYLTDHCIVTHNSAHYERPQKVEAALGDNTRVQVDISSVNGIGNPFYNRRKAGINWEADANIAPGFTRVFIIDWRDHPEKTQEWYDTRKAKHEREGMQHIFAQEVDRNYSASVSNTVIPLEYIQASVDAHLRLPQLMRNPKDIPNTWTAGLDVADGGVDRNALAKRQWVILRHVEEWGERDPGTTTRRALMSCRMHPGIRVMYDAIGVGSGVKTEYNRISIDEKFEWNGKFVAWNAGAGVLEPYNRIIPNDFDSLRNKDFFDNLKAQAWWSLYTRFYKTWKCIQALEAGGPMPDYKADELISIDSTIKVLHQLIEELAQATRGTSKGLRMIVEKQPDGTKSPNLADGVVMAYYPLPDDYSTVVVGNYG